MLTVVDHPLASHLLTELRNKETPPSVFRTLTKRLTTVLVLEATRDLPSIPRSVQTPLEPAEGTELTPGPVAVPVLRAGLGMLEAVTDLFPGVSVGYIGLERDERTFEAASYYEKLPPMSGKHAILLDPMLATGGTAARASSAIKTRDPTSVRMVCIVAAPEGVKRLEEAHPDVQVFTASLDRQLNDTAYILPGLGDFGDRLYGTQPA